MAPSRTLARPVLLLLGALLLGACDPSLFRKPAEEFRDGSRDLRAAYFAQLRIARDARLERFVVGRLDRLWARGDPGQARQAAEAIIKERTQRPELSPELLELRRAAFDAIDGYAGVLVALASGDDTAAIVADVNGLAGDLRKLVETAKTIRQAADLAGRVEAWLGPLAAAADLFGSVVEIISGAARDRAIRDAIAAADAPVRRLLELLGGEAAYARAEAKDQYAQALKVLDERLAEGTVDAAAEREVAEAMARIGSKAATLASAGEVKQGFAQAREAHAGLLRKAASPDYAQLLAELRAFRRRAEVLRASLDAVDAQR